MIQKKKVSDGRMLSPFIAYRIFYGHAFYYDLYVAQDGLPKKQFSPEYVQKANYIKTDDGYETIEFKEFLDEETIQRYIRELSRAGYNVARKDDEEDPCTTD